MMPMNLPNQQAPLFVHIDATNLALRMAMMMLERERYKNPGDIIKHDKKYGAYDFHGTLNPGQADKQVKTMKKAFTILQLNDEEKVSKYMALCLIKLSII